MEKLTGENKKEAQKTDANNGKEENGTEMKTKKIKQKEN